MKLTLKLTQILDKSRVQDYPPCRPRQDQIFVVPSGDSVGMQSKRRRRQTSRELSSGTALLIWLLTLQLVVNSSDSLSVLLYIIYNGASASFENS